MGQDLKRTHKLRESERKDWKVIKKEWLPTTDVGDILVSCWKYNNRHQYILQTKVNLPDSTVQVLEFDLGNDVSSWEIQAALIDTINICKKAFAEILEKHPEFILLNKNNK